MSMRRFSIPYFFLLVLILALQGCTEAMRKSFDAVPIALGMTGEIIVIADEDHWKGNVGDSLRYYFGGPYPILPQPEPMFDLRHFTPNELAADELRKELRTYMIIADLSDQDSPTTQMVNKDFGEEKFNRALSDPSFFSQTGREKWAQGQLIIYIFGKDEAALRQNIVRSFNAVANRVNEHDRNQLDASVFVEGEDYKLMAQVREKFGFEMRIPGDYQVAMEKPNFLWLRKDTKASTSSFMITSLPYTSTEMFTKERLISIQDSLGARYISSNELGSYIYTNVKDLPVFIYEKKIDGQYAIEGRGIWEMKNDFLGGPFSTYMILDQERNRVLFIEGFVYAPGKDKRLFIQAIEHIVTNIHI